LAQNSPVSIVVPGGAPSTLRRVAFSTGVDEREEKKMMRLLKGTMVAAVIVTLVSVAQSRAEEIPVSGEIVDHVPDQEGKFLFLPSGILISVGDVGYELLTGDLEGWMRVTSTVVLNTNTGEGILFGQIEWEDPNVAGSGFRGPFSGELSGALLPGAGGFDGKWTLRGYGLYQGWSARIDNYGPLSGDPPQVYEGVIGVPNGL
jgi:hypothetical protein